MVLMSLLVVLGVLADTPTPIIGGSWNFPDIVIDINFWVIIILFAAALLWHMVTRRRGGSHL